jgi:hypothetical protein
VPSKVINNTSPVEYLLEIKPDYKSLHFLGALAGPIGVPIILANLLSAQNNVCSSDIVRATKE